MRNQFRNEIIITTCYLSSFSSAELYVVAAVVRTFQLQDYDEDSEKAWRLQAFL